MVKKSNKLDKAKYLKRVIAVSWVALFLCFIVKIFGGNFFVIICESPNFIKLCKLADSNKFVFFLLGGIYGFVSSYFLILAMIQQFKFTKKQFWVFLFTIIAGSAVKTFNTTLGFAFDIWQFILMPFLFIGRPCKKWFIVILGNILTIVFQMISLFVKDLALRVVTDNGLLVGIVYSIDVILMYLLYYLYSNYKRKEQE